MSPMCPCFNNTPALPGSSPGFVRYGSYQRKNDRVKVRRYRCDFCGKTFSDSTSSQCYRQKKRHHNEMIYHLLAGGFTQRRSAIVLKLNRKTIVRKFLFMGKWAQTILPSLNAYFPKAKNLQFDDLLTYEHTKCKPLSVVMMVEDKSRWILGFRVASMPAFGPLAKKSVKKYGKRKDNRTFERRALFTEVAPFIEPYAAISSDESPSYLNDVKTHFPQATYRTYKGRKPRSAGLGELKVGGYDPLFTLNHTFAMYRSNMNRLFRKTWSTTKKAERLGLHIALYSLYHNLILIQKKSPAEAKAIRLAIA